MNVKNILIKAELEGVGIVNMDSNDQKWLFNKTKNGEYNKRENVSYAKKNFYMEGENLKYKIKISSDCIRNAMFKNEMVSQSPNITHNDAILYSFIATPMGMIRGYLFTNKIEPLKRSGALTICDAEQTCNAVSYIEICSKSGEKTSNDGTSEKSDTTFFKKETVGKIHYETEGVIDLSKLQFISADQVFDRYGLNPDKFSLWKQFMSLRLKNFNSNLGFYKLSTSVIDIPEQGVLFSNENVLDLVKDTLIRLLSLSIQRKGSYAKVNKLKIKLVYDPISDIKDNADSWIEIVSLEDINSLNFEVQEFYSLVDVEQAKLLRADIVSNLNAIKQTEKIENAKKAEASKAAKEIKKAKNNE
jgi:hypothetical protein